MKSIANKLKLKLQNVPLKEFKPSNTVHVLYLLMKTIGTISYTG